MMNTDKLQRVANALSLPVQALFSGGDEYLPIAVAEQILLESYRAIPNKDIQESILKITTNATRQDK